MNQSFQIGLMYIYGNWKYIPTYTIPTNWFLEYDCNNLNDIFDVDKLLFSEFT